MGALMGLVLSALVGAPPSARAEVLTAQVAPLHSRTPTGPCPTTVTLEQTLQPYREGSYGVDGRASTEAVATGWRLTGRDAFSATWEASLRPAFRRCLASAGIAGAASQPSRDHSYLRLRFREGRLQLILDMTGQRDPNGYTPAILRAAVSQGQPVWTWGGSD